MDEPEQVIGILKYCVNTVSVTDRTYVGLLPGKYMEYPCALFLTTKRVITSTVPLPKTTETINEKFKEFFSLDFSARKILSVTSTVDYSQKIMSPEGLTSIKAEIDNDDVIKIRLYSLDKAYALIPDAPIPQSSRSSGKFSINFIGKWKGSKLLPGPQPHPRLNLIINQDAAPLFKDLIAKTPIASKFEYLEDPKDVFTDADIANL